MYAPTIKGIWGRRRRRSGVALILAVLVVAISLLLLLAFLDTTATDLELSNSYTRYLKAGFAARAGIESAMGRLTTDPTADLTETDVALPPGSSVAYSVSATGTGPIIVTSTGNCAGLQRVAHGRIEMAEGQPILTRYWED